MVERQPFKLVVMGSIPILGVIIISLRNMGMTLAFIILFIWLFVQFGPMAVVILFGS